MDLAVEQDMRLAMEQDMRLAMEEYAKEHDYENWLLSELIDLCKTRGLKCTRTKDDLIERLVRDDTKFLKRLKEYIDKYGEDFSDENADEWLSRARLCDFSSGQLKEQCKFRDISISGDKATLCYNIKKYDEDMLNRMKRFVDRYL